MKINEIFEGIQGEGKYAGYPALFIRLSGCNLNCSFCDTKYHRFGKNMPVKQIIKVLLKSHKEIVVWTGGEPTLQVAEILKACSQSKNKLHHIETNGHNINFPKLRNFDYISISPKNKEDAKLAFDYFKKSKRPNIDIKVVTDLKFNKELIKYATILMPLEISNKLTDNKTRQNVWEYCVQHNLRYSPRIQTMVWGYKKKGK